LAEGHGEGGHAVEDEAGEPKAATERKGPAEEEVGDEAEGGTSGAPEEAGEKVLEGAAEEGGGVEESRVEIEGGEAVRGLDTWGERV
ncbi:hypothetical protein ABTM12_19815, partial [Acinetobacter baumannii]